MAELLIYQKSKYGIFSSPEKYDTGDIVMVMPDGHVWGVRECLHTFYIVRVETPLSDAIKYMWPLYNPVQTITIKHPVTGLDYSYDAPLSVKLKRRYKFDITNGLSVALKDQMLNSLTLLIPTVSVSNITDKSLWL